MAKNPHKSLLPLLLVTAATAVLLLLDILSGDSGFGAVHGTLLTQIRLPRVLTAILVGASLGLGGAQMQAVFRNPLADPHIMGISSGAGLGAAIAVLAIPSAAMGIPVGAILGALLTSLLVVAAAGRLATSAFEVSMITGMCEMLILVLTILNMVKPSISGIITSLTTTSYSLVNSSFRPSLPFGQIPNL